MSFMKYIFIRDDDVSELSQNLERLWKLCSKWKAPIVFGAIPKKINPSAVKFLLKVKKQEPELVDIVQHGWEHKNYGSEKEKYEFGKTRNYSQQKKDILNGKKLMKKYFGKDFFPAFIPPFHGYDENTLKIISQLKFKVFSGGEKTNLKGIPFLDLPTRVSLNKYTKKEPLTFPLEEIIKKIVRELNFGPLNVWGVLLHHRDIQNFEVVDKTIRALKIYEKNKKIKLINFSRLTELNVRIPSVVYAFKPSKGGR